MLAENDTHSRETIKARVRAGELRLLLAPTRLLRAELAAPGTLINLDLPWNPTRLEQRKDGSRRIGQIHDMVQIYNLPL